MKVNQSLRFLLPILPNTTPKLYLRKGFIGAFIGDKEKPQWDGRLLLAYHFNTTEKTLNFEIETKKMSEFIGSYLYLKPDNKIIMVYGFSTDTFREDFENVIDGRYSKMSPENKLKVAKFWQIYSDTKLPGNIVNKDKDMKYYWIKVGKNPKDYCAKEELWYKPNIEEEIFDKNKFI